MLCASNRPLPPPLSEDFSLTDSSDSVAEIRDARDSKDAQTKLIGHPFKDPVYVLYVGDSNIRTMSEAEFDREQLTEDVSRLPRTGQIVAVRLVELLEAAASVQDKVPYRERRAVVSDTPNTCRRCNVAGLGQRV